MASFLHDFWAMIQKSSYSNLYLGISQAKRERGAQTVWLVQADRPAWPGGPSAGAARTVHAGRGSSGRYQMLWKYLRTVRHGVSDRSRSSRTVHKGVTDYPREQCTGGAEVVSCKSSMQLLFFPTRKESSSSSLSCSLSQGKEPPLGIWIGALPGPSEHIHRLSARFSTMSSGYFFRLTHSLTLLDFEQEGG
jgi:hypothetical protein